VSDAAGWRRLRTDDTAAPPLLVDDLVARALADKGEKDERNGDEPKHNSENRDFVLNPDRDQCDNQRSDQRHLQEPACYTLGGSSNS